MTSQNGEMPVPQKIQDWLKNYSPNGPVVVIPVFNAFDDVQACLDSLVATCPAGTPILVIDDASTDTRLAPVLESRCRQEGLAYVRKAVNGGFVDTVNSAFAWCAPHDVVIINSDVVVPPAWLERLQAAAYCRPGIATATPLTNNGTLLSVPYRNEPIATLPAEMSLIEADRRIRAMSLRLRPVIPTAIGHCIYFTRAALETVGYLDPVFSPGYGEEVDFSQRAILAGFDHVAADDLFVLHEGSRSFGPARGRKGRLQEAHERINYARYPWYRQWVTETALGTDNALARVIERARTALLGYRLAIDGRNCGEVVNVLESLVQALGPRPLGPVSQRPAILVDRPLPAELQASLACHGDIVFGEGEIGQAGSFDLIHRLALPGSARELSRLRRLTGRLIILGDSSSFGHPGQDAGAQAWPMRRQITRQAFSLADGVLFSQEVEVQVAAQQGLYVPADRQAVMRACSGPDADPVGGIWEFYERILTMPPRSAEFSGLPARGGPVWPWQWPGELWRRYGVPMLRLWRTGGWPSLARAGREFIWWRLLQTPGVSTWLVKFWGK